MAEFNMTFDGGKSFNVTMSNGQGISADFGNVQTIETGDYNKLRNKPSIENVTLEGNKTIDQLGVRSLTVQEIEKILYLD